MPPPLPKTHPLKWPAQRKEGTNHSEGNLSGTKPSNDIRWYHQRRAEAEEEGGKRKKEERQGIEEEWEEC